MTSLTLLLSPVLHHPTVRVYLHIVIILVWLGLQSHPLWNSAAAPQPIYAAPALWNGLRKTYVNYSSSYPAWFWPSTGTNRDP